MLIPHQDVGCDEGPHVKPAKMYPVSARFCCLLIVFEKNVPEYFIE